MKTVLIPAENLPDLEQIDPSVRKGMEFLPMETIDQVLSTLWHLPEKSDAHRSMDPPVVLVKNPLPAKTPPSNNNQRRTLCHCLINKPPT